tara:strand:+ start:198 stop:1178 length:981 start_codon:yes stop_codon:yes gene_type:complete
MGFLDNSGDIILDAVLTDVGRNRLARGDGSFRIEKFALSDDEINYELYRNSNHANGAHASGSAYYDLNILQTPVLEASTNNISTMKHKLLTIPRTNLLYMPMLKLNEGTSATARNTTAAQANGKFVILVDEDSSKAYNASTSPGLFESDAGMINGVTGQGINIRLDHGLNTDDISPKSAIPSDLVETSYLLQIDNRLGAIVPPGSLNQLPAAFSFLDDDNIAHYQLDIATDAAFIKKIANSKTVEEDTSMVIKGPRSTMLAFSVVPSIELQDSNMLFTKLGSLNQSWTPTGVSAVTIHYVDTIIRVTGNTTGYRIDVPVRFVKKIS